MSGYFSVEVTVYNGDSPRNVVARIKKQSKYIKGGYIIIIITMLKLFGMICYLQCNAAKAL